MASFMASLVFPVALILNAIHVVIDSFTSGRSQPFPFLALVYTTLDFCAFPVILFAIILGHVALIGAGACRRLAKLGLIMAYGSWAGLPPLAVVVIAVSVSRAGR